MRIQKYLDDIEWVAKAASKDQGRPILTGILRQRTGEMKGRLAATNGHVLHVADVAYPIQFPGVALLSGKAIDGQFPHIDHVIPTKPATHVISDVARFLATCEAAAAFGKAMGVKGPAKENAIRLLGCDFEPRYLLDAIQGAILTDNHRIEVYCKASVLRLAFGIERKAVIMGVREAKPRFAVDEFLEKIS